MKRERESLSTSKTSLHLPKLTYPRTCSSGESGGARDYYIKAHSCVTSHHNGLDSGPSVACISCIPPSRSYRCVSGCNVSRPKVSREPPHAFAMSAGPRTWTFRPFQTTPPSQNVPTLEPGHVRLDGWLSAFSHAKRSSELVDLSP